MLLLSKMTGEKIKIRANLKRERVSEWEKMWEVVVFRFPFGCLTEIARFLVTSSLSKNPNLKSQQSIFPRQALEAVYFCLQFCSSIAFFVWKPGHFEFQDQGGE